MHTPKLMEPQVHHHVVWCFCYRNRTSLHDNAFPGGAYTFKGPDDTVYTKSESGWVDSEIFPSWVNKVFQFAVPQRSVMFVDGH